MLKRLIKVLLFPVKILGLLIMAIIEIPVYIITGKHILYWFIDQIGDPF